MSERAPAFLSRMQALAAHVRRPDTAPAPAGVPQQRVSLYRSLFLNNIGELLASTLPITRAQTAEEVWHYWVETFYADHPHASPYFKEIAGEFVAFLHASRVHHPQELLALRELAHFEWAQWVISIDVDASGAEGEREPIRAEGFVSLSPAVAVLAYEHPVHDPVRLHEPETTVLLLYRDAEDQVQKMLLTPLAAQLLELVPSQPALPVAALLSGLAEAMGQSLTPPLEAWALGFLNDMQMRGVLTVCRSINETS